MFEAISACVAWNAFFTTVFNPQLFWKLEIFLKFFFFISVNIMKKLKLYKRNKSQKSKLSEIFDVVKNADRRACSLLTLLTVTKENISERIQIYWKKAKFSVFSNTLWIEYLKISVLIFFSYLFWILFLKKALFYQKNGV